MRIERRDSPILPGGVEVIGRCPDPGGRCDDVLPEPGVGAVGGEADRKVVDHRDLTPRPVELGVETPLQPPVEVDPLPRPGHERFHGRAVGSPVLLRPRGPRTRVPLGDHAEAGVTLEQLALAGDEGVEARIAAEPGPEGFERPHLQGQDQVAVDEGRFAERLGRASSLLHELISPGPGDILDAQVERVAEEPARWEVRARFLGQPGMHRMQRVDQEHRCAVLPSTMPRASADRRGRPFPIPLVSAPRTAAPPIPSRGARRGARIAPGW